MIATPQTVKLAFILALQDIAADSLTETEIKNIQRVGKGLQTRSEAWLKIEPLLLETIEGNAQLNKSFHLYKKQIEKLEEIPPELTSQLEEFPKLPNQTQSLATRGFTPESPAESYEEQINNAVIIIGQSDKPTEIVQKMTFFAKLKSFLISKIA